MRRVVVCVALGATLLVASACGTPRPSTEGTTPPTVTLPTPSANAYVDAVVHTRGLATAALDLTVVSSVGDTSRTLRGTGVSALDRGFGDLTWTSADGTVTRELSNGKGLFVKTDGADGLWTALPDQNATPTGRLADPLRGLGTLPGVRADGVESVDGRQATRYRGQAPADAAALALLGLTDSEVETLARITPVPVVDVTVWVGDNGRVLRVDRSLTLDESQAGPVSAHTSTTLSDFSALIDLSPPPTESVSSAAG